MKKLQKILILLVFVLLMTACSKKDDNDDDDRKKKPQEKVEQEAETEVESEDAEQFYKIDKKRYKAYVVVLKGIIDDNKWPDGQQVLPDGQYRGNNQFAIFDVDMDGEEELLVNITDAPTAGMVMQIFEYDAKKDEVVLGEGFYPAVEFFDNGIVKQYSSHNHTSSEVWPYTVSKYNPEKKSYEVVGSMYAEDKEIAGASFASNKDADNDGRIYYVSSKDLVDKALTEKEYQEWDAAFIGDANELYIPWQQTWDTNVQTIETVLAKEGAVLPIPLGYNINILNYDVTGDGEKDDIFITCDNSESYYEGDMIGSDWVIEINGEKAHDFEWNGGIKLIVELYQVSDKRQYLSVLESYEANGDRSSFALYQIVDGKLEEVCDFHKNIVKSINAFHYGSKITYMTPDEILVRAHNQFNATAFLEFDMKYNYVNDEWKSEGNEYTICYDQDYLNKKDGMKANQSFVVYTDKDCKTEAFKVEKGDEVKFHSVFIKDGKTIFKVTNEDGEEGWLPDAEESYKEIDGGYLEGYFEESMFAG